MTPLLVIAPSQLVELRNPKVVFRDLTDASGSYQSCKSWVFTPLCFSPTHMPVRFIFQGEPEHLLNNIRTWCQSLCQIRINIHQLHLPRSQFPYETLLKAEMTIGNSWSVLRIRSRGSGGHLLVMALRGRAGDRREKVGGKRW